MFDFEKIAYYLNDINGLELEDIQEVLSLFKEVRLQPDDVFIEHDSSKNIVGYIKKGIIRVYTIDETGTEKTLLLRWDNQFVGSHDNIILNRPSRFIYQAIEPTEMIQLSYDDLQVIVSKNQKLEELRKDFLLKMLQETLEQLEAFVLLTPEERYIQFLQSKSNVVNRVPDKYIANIIGVTPQSLSRIRKRIASKNH